MATNKIVGDLVKYYINTLKSNTGFERVLNQVNVIHAADGKCIAEFKVSEGHLNGLGGMHGGFSSTLVDCLSSLALITKEDHPHVSVNINMSFFKGAKLGDNIVVDSKIVKHGKSLAFLNTIIKNEQGDLLVNGDHTKYILRK